MIWWSLAPWIIGAMFIVGGALAILGSWGLVTEKVVEDDHD